MQVIPQGSLPQVIIDTFIPQGSLPQVTKDTSIPQGSLPQVTKDTSIPQERKPEVCSCFYDWNGGSTTWSKNVKVQKVLYRSVNSIVVCN